MLEAASLEKTFFRNVQSPKLLVTTIAVNSVFHILWLKQRSTGGVYYLSPKYFPASFKIPARPRLQSIL